MDEVPLLEMLKADDLAEELWAPRTLALKEAGTKADFAIWGTPILLSPFPF
jgi:hypothetical protein